jgi:hypothetical protein
MNKRFMRFLSRACCLPVAALALAATAHATTATCPSDVGPGGKPGNWKATYTIQNNAVFGPLIKFSALGFVENGKTATVKSETFASTAGKPWLLRTDGNIDGLSGDTATIVATLPSALQLPRLTTPDKRCSLQLAPYTFAPATGPKVAIVGDSIVNSYTSTAQDRQTVSNHIASTHKWRFHPDALGGRALSTDTVDKAGSAMAEILGVLATSPKALVVELSTNDAIGLAFARECRDGYGIGSLPDFHCENYPQEKAIQHGKNVTQDLVDITNLAIAKGVCLVFVTPQTDYWAYSDLAYIIESSNIRQQMLDADTFFSTLYPKAKIGYMDWATIAASGDYRGSDHLHLNDIGKLVHLASWIDAVSTTCGI